MLPGITPWIADGGPPLSGSISPAVADWSGAFPNYQTTMSAITSGGVTPLGYAWVAPGVTIFAGQGTASVDLRSGSGPAAAVTCTVTDASGATLLLEGTVNAVSGGGGA